MQKVSYSEDPSHYCKVADLADTQWQTTTSEGPSTVDVERPLFKTVLSSGMSLETAEWWMSSWMLTMSSFTCSEELCTYNQNHEQWMSHSSWMLALAYLHSNTFECVCSAVMEITCIAIKLQGSPAGQICDIHLTFTGQATAKLYALISTLTLTYITIMYISIIINLQCSQS